MSFQIQIKQSLQRIDNLSPPWLPALRNQHWRALVNASQSRPAKWKSLHFDALLLLWNLQRALVYATIPQITIVTVQNNYYTFGTYCCSFYTSELTYSFCQIYDIRCRQMMWWLLVARWWPLQSMFMALNTHAMQRYPYGVLFQIKMKNKRICFVVQASSSIGPIYVFLILYAHSK